MKNLGNDKVVRLWSRLRRGQVFGVAKQGENCQDRS